MPPYRTIRSGRAHRFHPVDEDRARAILIVRPPSICRSRLSILITRKVRSYIQYWRNCGIPMFLIMFEVCRRLFSAFQEAYTLDLVFTASRCYQRTSPRTFILSSGYRPVRIIRTFKNWTTLMIAHAKQ